MDLVLLAVKNDLDNVLQTGGYLLTTLFTLAVFINYLGILSNKSNWSDLLMRLVVGFILIQNYVWVMDTTKNIVVGLDQKINPEQSYVNQYAAMSDNMQKTYEANTQTNFVSQVTGLFGRFTLHNLIINLSFIFYAVISKVMESIRYALVGIMYKLGPVLVPLILFSSTSKILKGWFTSYVSILCWPILWHIALSVAVALSAQIGSSGQGIEQFACLNFAVCFVLIFTPLIISSLVAGVGIGGAASIAGAVISRTALNSITQLGKTTVRTMAAVGSGVQAMQDLRTPTTMSGKFKTFMTGAETFAFSNSSQSIKKTFDKGKKK